MDVLRKIENRRLEIDEELRHAGRAFADGVFSEKDYISEKDSLIVPDDAKALEMSIQLENIGDFFEDATIQN